MHSGAQRLLWKGIGLGPKAAILYSFDIWSYPWDTNVFPLTPAQHSLTLCTSVELCQLIDALWILRQHSASVACTSLRCKQNTAGSDVKIEKIGQYRPEELMYTISYPILQTITCPHTIHHDNTPCRKLARRILPKNQKPVALCNV